MDPSVWGPSTWKSLHAIAAHSDVTKNADAFWTYVRTLNDVLPCDSCKKHMKDYIETHPRPLDNFFEYTVAFHNDVNARLGKELVSPDEARKEFSRMCTTSCNNESHNQAGVVILYLTIMISTLLIFLFLKRHIK